MIRLPARWAAAAAAVLGAFPATTAADDAPAPARPAEARTVDAALPSPEEAWLGLSFDPATTPPRVRSVTPGGPAHRAGLRAGDAVAALEGVEPPDGRVAAWMIRMRVPGERILVEFLREGIRGAAPVTLGSRPGGGALFRGPVFRLAVLPVEFADLPRPRLPDDLLLDRMFFSRDAYRDRLPSGRRLHGSVRDYWSAQSWGALDLVGRVLPTVTVPTRTAVFAAQPMGAGPESAWARALAALHVRDGDAVLDPFDGIAFLYPGAVASPPRRALWPHRATIRTGGRVLPYFVKNAGEGAEPEPVGVICHEFGHLLGLPDQYGTAHRTGVGDFCLMAIGHRGGGESGADRPFGLCAWCRTVTGWARPAPVDPADPQDLALAPVSTGPGEIFLVPGASAGESWLLENRRREGWDADLPGEGLLVWHAGGDLLPGDPPDRPWLDLVEAHGIEVPDASLLRPDRIPFPGPRGGALTAETHPGRAGNLRLTRIRRLPGGRIAFRLGGDDPVAASPGETARVPVDGEGFALLRDPVTGEDVRVFMGPPEHAPARPAEEVDAALPVAGD